MVKKIKRSKFRAQKVIIDGYKFDSKLEGEYYKHLKSQKVKNVLVHPRYILQDGFKVESSGEKVQPIYYIGDFEFSDKEGPIVIDVKGLPTEAAKIKRKLFLKKYPEIRLIWVVRYQGVWVDYFQNEKRKRANKSLVTKKTKGKKKK